MTWIYNNLQSSTESYLQGMISLITSHLESSRINREVQARLSIICFWRNTNRCERWNICGETHCNYFVSYNHACKVQLMILILSQCLVIILLFCNHPADLMSCSWLCGIYLKMWLIRNHMAVCEIWYISSLLFLYQFWNW